MDLHTLHNGGNGTWDVIYTDGNGTAHYLADDFDTKEHAEAYIAGWQDRGEFDASLEEPYSILMMDSYDSLNHFFNRRAD